MKAMIQQFEEKCQEKNQVKFVILLDGLFICLFQFSCLVIEVFRISMNLLPFLASGSEILLSSKSRSKDATLHLLEATGGNDSL